MSDYFSDYSAVSQSMLKVFCQRRRLYHDYYVARTVEPPQPTDAMRKGTATHTAVLEPEKFDSLVKTYPKNILARNGAASTNDSKAFREEHEASGCVVLKESEADDVRAMAESVQRTIIAAGLNVPCEREVEARWICSETGLPLKARIDWFIPAKRPVVLDLKTCADASPAEFRRTCERLRYGIQQAQYEVAVPPYGDGELPLFYFVAVEDSYPFACAIHELDVAAAIDARLYRLNKLRQLKACMESNDWCEPWERRINSLSLRSLRFEE